MGAAEQLDALRWAYQDYMTAYAQRVVDNGVLHGLHKFLLGNSTPSDRKADTGFYYGVEKTVEELCRSLTEDDGHIAEAAVRLMVLEAEGSDPSSTLMIEATQALAIPLLPHLSPSARAEIAREYEARYPKKRQRAPRQNELLAALKSN